MSRDLSPILPQACLVRFPGRRCGGTPDQPIPTWYTHKVTLLSLIGDLNTDLTAWEQTIPSDLSGSIGNAVFHETAQALFDPPGADPTNKATLDLLAEVIARDFYRWRLIAFDLVYRGVLNPLPTALYDDIQWRYRANGVTTRLLSSSLGGVNAGGGGGGSIEELNHSDGLHEKDCKDAVDYSTIVSKLPAAEMYGPFTGSTTGTMHLPVFLVNLIDGRINSKYSRTDVLNCACVSSCGQVCVTVRGCTSTVVSLVPGATVTLTAIPVSSVNVSNGGHGYTDGSYTNGTFTGGGSGAGGGTFSYTVSGGVIQPGITITQGGGYVSAPAPVFNAGPGTGAVATATLGTAVTIGTCTTVSQVTAAGRSSGGSGYADGTHTDGTFTGGGGSGGSFTYTITGGIVQTGLVVTAGGSGYTLAPTPVLGPASGSGSGFVGTTTIASMCCIPIVFAGDYTVTVSGVPSASNQSQLFAATCTTNNRTFSFATGGPGSIKVNYLRCAASGVSITVSGPGGTFSGSPSAGDAEHGIPGTVTFSGLTPGSYTVTTNASGYIQTQNVTVTACTLSTTSFSSIDSLLGQMAIDASCSGVCSGVTVDIYNSVGTHVGSGTTANNGCVIISFLPDLPFASYTAIASKGGKSSTNTISGPGCTCPGATANLSGTDPTKVFPNNIICC